MWPKASSGLANRHITALSIFHIGGPAWNWTKDTPLFKRVLYRTELQVRGGNWI